MNEQMIFNTAKYLFFFFILFISSTA